jgi:hypothetical protein
MFYVLASHPQQDKKFAEQHFHDIQHYQSMRTMELKYIRLITSYTTPIPKYIRI